MNMKDIYVPMDDPFWIEFNQWLKDNPTNMEEVKKELISYVGRPHGYRASEETRQRMSAAQVGNKKCVGRVISEETRRKIGEANKGKQARLGAVLSDETKKKISDSLKKRNSILNP